MEGPGRDLEWRIFSSKMLIVVFEIIRATTQSVCGWLHDYPQRLKSTFFEKNFLTPLKRILAFKADKMDFFPAFLKLIVNLGAAIRNRITILTRWLLFFRPNTVYNQMGLLLKSILCVSRVLPAYKFARRQGPDTHVMCYRIFAGEPNSNPLGKDYQTACVSKKIEKNM